jgi:hypothetical protein
MVQGPSAHVVLRDRIYVDFTDLSTVIETPNNSSPDCTVTEYVQSFRSIARVATKRVLLPQTKL